MRTSETFTKGKKDGRSGLKPKPVGGKIAYALGYEQGRSEWNQQQLINHLNRKT